MHLARYSLPYGCTHSAESGAKHNSQTPWLDVMSLMTGDLAIHVHMTVTLQREYTKPVPWMLGQISRTAWGAQVTKGWEHCSMHDIMGCRAHKLCMLSYSGRGMSHGLRCENWCSRPVFGDRRFPSAFGQCHASENRASMISCHYTFNLSGQACRWHSNIFLMRI